MTKRRKKVSKARRRLSDSKHFKSLTTYMAKVAKGTLSRHRKFSLCVKASACKCFEFNLAVQNFAESKTAFFAMAPLRGICEDLIVLRYIGKMPSKDREGLIAALAGHEIGTRVKLQDTFFRTIRPQQPVLRHKDADALIASNGAAARSIWQQHGWPNLDKGAMPQIRQIAEKQGLHQLAVLYDYLYRLTSAGVHFNVQSLLRSGWGSPKNFVFSAKNFPRYFENYCALYGKFLFCLYFEFFGTVLRPTAKERAIVDKIRQDVLYTPRWPEMVTYEEMNVTPPTNGETFRMIVSAFQAVSRKRLISKGVNYGKKHSREKRLISQALRALAKSASTNSDHKSANELGTDKGRKP
jgi:hypothetical protein